MTASIDSNSKKDIMLRATRIYDYYAPSLDTLSKELPCKSDPLTVARTAYYLVRDQVSPIYSLEETRPASHTLIVGKGSCSQRLAVVESLCRKKGIGTRVRALWIRGEFWAPRFPNIASFLPSKVLLPWPQFHINNEWIGVEDLFGPLSERVGPAFTNSSETLFEAIEKSPLDFEGRYYSSDSIEHSQVTTNSSCGCIPSNGDLSKWVLNSAGIYSDRDRLWTEHTSLEFTIQGKLFKLLYGNKRSWTD